MKKLLLVTGSIVLLAFIGYGIWDAMGGKMPLLFYTMEAEKIVRDAEVLAGAHKAAGVKPDQLKETATRMRAQFNTINTRCTTGDRKRPSFEKLGKIVDQVEAAAEKAESKDVVDARMNSLDQLAKELKSILGTDQDKPGQ